MTHSPLAEISLEKGANVIFHDPHVTVWARGEHRVPHVDDLDEAPGKADLSVLLQNHIDYDLAAMAATARQFLDTRGATTDAAIRRL